MAGVFATWNTGFSATTAATYKTFLQIVAATNQRVMLTNLSVLTNDAVADNVRVRLIRQDDAGSGSSAVTGDKVNWLDTETLQTTAIKTPSSEPAVVTRSEVVLELSVNEPNGLQSKSMNVVIPGGSRLGVQIYNAVGTDSMSVHAITEE